MKTTVYPVGPDNKDATKLKFVALLVSAVFLGGVVYDSATGVSVSEDGTVIKPLPKRRASIVIDQGPNQGETVRASYESLENAFTTQARPQEGDKVQVTVTRGGLTGLTYRAKFTNRR